MSPWGADAERKQEGGPRGGLRSHAGQAAPTASPVCRGGARVDPEGRGKCEWSPLRPAGSWASEITLQLSMADREALRSRRFSSL